MAFASKPSSDTSSNMDERDFLISCYFDIGMSQKEILAALANHGHIISLRHLKRILSSMALTRRKNFTDIADVVISSFRKSLWGQESCMAIDGCGRNVLIMD